jgi:peptidyl-prolyl cis-trans isomerase-like 3
VRREIINSAQTEGRMSVTLHTDLGDIKIEVECQAAKKTAYNFLALCASGYYDNTIIHRNIKGFMVQMGDPAGSGKGGFTNALSCADVLGASIWNDKFEDEISPNLRVCLIILAQSHADSSSSTPSAYMALCK